MSRHLASLRRALLTLALLLAMPGIGVGDDFRCAWIGKPIAGQPYWPEGLTRFLNASSRTNGWTTCYLFEPPSDVSSFWFHVKSTEELNGLLEQFGAIASDKLEIQVSLEPSPGPGGTEFHGESVSLTIGDQPTLDRWYNRLPLDESGRRVHYSHRYDKPLVAMPPRLTIYLGDKDVDVSKLKFPAKVPVEYLRTRVQIHRNRSPF